MNPAADAPADAVAGRIEGDARTQAPAQARLRMSEPEFERLYAATAGPVFGYLAAVSGRRDLADDLLQETYCRLLARSESLALMDAQQTRRYLFRIATNLLRDRWRAGEGQPFAEPAEAAEDPRLDSSVDVRAMMQHLKPRERELLWLAYVEGMDHAEIAAATGLGRLSVRTLLFRARRKAQQYLSPQPDAERKNCR